MAMKIRLARGGSKKRPHYSIVAAESRAALMKDPASQFLAAQLARSYTTKLTLLRSTATMPVGD